MITSNDYRRLHAAIFLLLSMTAPAWAVNQHVDNFVLLDHTGAAQELYYQRDAKAVVLIVQGNGCQIVRSTLPDYKALRDDYAARGVRVLMINSNLQDDRASIAAEASEWGIDIPIMHDSAQIIGPSLQLNRTAEVLVIDPENWKIVYRGALNNRVDYERQKNEADQHYVRDVLNALIADEEVVFTQVNSPGCIINYPLRDNAQAINYAADIAPILQENCMACHVEGGIAPWAMSEYRLILGFAPMIREVIRTKRMPPWHADPAIGHWVDDTGLSDAQKGTLVTWIEAGAARGEGDDPLRAQRPRMPVTWPLGPPDLVLEAPAFDVPATGIVDYRYPAIDNPHPEDVWVVAATIVPGDRTVVHHVLLGTASQALKKRDRQSVFENFITSFAPGEEYARMPAGTGVFVPAGGAYQLQLHYSPTGKATTDKTRFGLYFAKRPPANFLHQHVVLNRSIAIPPHTQDHPETAYFEFWEDAIIYSLRPHSHYRGRSSTFELLYPNGDIELVLSVPTYDFNWQRTYRFAEPRQVPAGTRIIHRTVYDNSILNRGNPDPRRTVPWGRQSQDEMLYGLVSYSWARERSDAPLHSKLTADTAQWMGYLDVDMDGKVAINEMPTGWRKALGWQKFQLLDGDGDGGLNLAEMEVLVSRVQER